MPANNSGDAPVNVKLLLIGNSSVGKSSFLLRFSDEQWLPEDEASATIGVDFRVSGICCADAARLIEVSRCSKRSYRCIRWRSKGRRSN